MNKIIASILIIFTAIFLSSCDYSTDEEPMSMGKTNAPVLIEEFSDVECPACGQISPQVEELAKNNPDIVRLVYYHFPLSYHEFAFAGAEATECAGDQGKAWEYLAILFENGKSLSDDFFYSAADSVGLNKNDFTECLTSHVKKNKINSHLREGKSRSIPGTPTIFINGQVAKWAGLEQMDAYVKSLVE